MSIDYKKWQMLNEALNAPLGIETYKEFALLANLLKKKAKDGDKDDDNDDDEDEDDEDEEVKDKKKVGDCGCDHKPVAENTQLVSENVEDCPSWEKPKVSFDELMRSYEDAIAYKRPKIGTSEYRDYFKQSLEKDMFDPTKKWSSGIELGEDVLLPPANGNTFSEVQPGNVGFAPETPLGDTDLDNHYNVMDVDEYLASLGLKENFSNWTKSRRK